MNLSTLYATLSTEEKEALAEKAGIKPAYLWQIATGWQGRKPSVDLIQRLAKANSKLSVAEIVDEFADEKAS